MLLIPGNFSNYKGVFFSLRYKLRLAVRLSVDAVRLDSGAEVQSTAICFTLMRLTREAQDLIVYVGDAAFRAVISA